MIRCRRPRRDGGQWTARPIEMLESPAYRVLSKTGHRLLALLEAELARRGGEGNGHLVLTYKDCVGSGIDRHAIHPALLEVQALGFVE